MTTSAARRQFRPLSVINSGSPGPAPTRKTLPRGERSGNCPGASRCRSNVGSIIPLPLRSCITADILFPFAKFCLQCACRNVDTVIFEQRHDQCYSFCRITLDEFFQYI